IETIIRKLTRRFGNVPESVEEHLYKIKDVEHLDQFVDLAFDCQTLEDFENVLTSGLSRTRISRPRNNRR
ncbi:MAG: DUF4351 domain-containing protein, partial [Planctomycetaceae bacterium]|nr:DUF4351 domain-containing protein [Planctomycetaceae bacterium]